MSTLKPAAEIAAKGSKPFPNESAEYRAGAQPARRGDRAAPPHPARRRTCAARCRRAASPRTIASSTRTARNSAWSICSGSTTRSSPTSGCTGPSVSGPARCAPRSSARSTSRARHRAAHRDRHRRPLAGRTAARLRARARLDAPRTSTRPSATTSPRDYRGLVDGEEGRSVLGLEARGRQGPPVLGGRGRKRPPIPGSTRIWRPTRRRSGTSSTGRRAVAARLVSEVRLRPLMLKSASDLQH